MSDKGRHVAVIVGGAVSGSTAAEILADAGCLVVVVEQNTRPYGKIEDGLPKWHRRQRLKEYGKINGRLDRDDVLFVPETKLGEDIGFNQILEEWQPSFLFLANGAWKDRPLGIDDADEYVENGLLYQNPFIYWFNHKNEKAYDGPEYELEDNIGVIGGGLASIDVVKAIQLELYTRALAERGIDVDLVHMEHKGIPYICDEHDIEPEDLGIEGCILYYRRRKYDMPLAFPPDNATEAQKKKIEEVRVRILTKCMDKYLFRFQDQTLPEGLIVEDGRLVGLKMVRTEVEGRKAIPKPETAYEARHSQIISSIGSIPEPLPEVPQRGSWYEWEDWDLGIMKDYPTVYGIGNVVTGKGNIRDSLVHAREVANHVLESYLLGEGKDDLDQAMEAGEAKGAAAAKKAVDDMKKKTPLSPEKVQNIQERVARRQKELGYTDYATWIEEKTPDDLE